MFDVLNVKVGYPEPDMLAERKQAKHSIETRSTLLNQAR